MAVRLTPYLRSAPLRSGPLRSASRRSKLRGASVRGSDPDWKRQEGGSRPQKLPNFCLIDERSQYNEVNCAKMVAAAREGMRVRAYVCLCVCARARRGRRTTPEEKWSGHPPRCAGRWIDKK